MPKLILKPGREKSVLRFHPWIFSGAVASLQGQAKTGETIEIVNSTGNFLAWGSYNEKSRIVSRIWSWNPDIEIGADFFSAQIKRSIDARQAIVADASPQKGIRWVHGESDGLPGLIVDQYADVLVVQFLAAGVEFWREEICRLLMDLSEARYLFERSDLDVRKLEGLELRTGILQGGKPPEKVMIVERQVKFWVDIYHGHKTGFYLDQSLNRSRVRDLGKNKVVLDCFCYTGGFGINALVGGARSVLSLDASEESLALARENYALNNMGEEFNSLEGDAFTLLRQFRDRDLHFDLIILDPPKFAQSASMVERAARGYKDINLLAFKLLRPGGYLVTFSCSGGVSEDLFQKIVTGAALDAKVNAQILERLHQSPDHPVSLYFPEGSYLKGFILRVG